VSYEWLAVALEALRGIEPYEVMQALAASRRRPVLAEAAGVVVLTVWAKTAAGRPLIVVVRPAGGFDWVIVGAREMDEEQLTEFEQWEAGR
jgi:hypothetical protein